MLGRQGQALHVEDRGVQEQLFEKRPDLREQLHNAVKTLRGHGLKWARMGIVGNAMRKLWEKCGMGEGNAERVAEMAEKAGALVSEVGAGGMQREAPWPCGRHRPFEARPWPVER